jgi:signal transduction histidine kinase
MSHEVNSPLGTLKSTIDTWFLLASRDKDADAQSARLSKVQTELRRTLDESVKRMSEVIERIQRWTNLDRADIQYVDLNLLLFDLLMLRLTPAGADTPVPDIRLGDLPEIFCRPMTLRRVFAGLIDHAVRRAQAAEDGSGCVDIWTRPQGDDVIVEIADNGPPVPPEEAAQFFNLVFRIEGTRMTCNWDLFTARSDLREQGGDIRRESTPDRANRFIVRLPLRLHQD